MRSGTLLGLGVNNSQSERENTKLVALHHGLTPGFSLISPCTTFSKEHTGILYKDDEGSTMPTGNVGYSFKELSLRNKKFGLVVRGESINDKFFQNILVIATCINYLECFH